MIELPIEDVDFLIVGAGQAGMVAHRLLDSESKVIVDPSPGGYKIGESIVPEHFAHPELRALIPAIQELPSYTPKRGVVFVGDHSVACFPLTERNQYESMHVVRHELEALMASAWDIDVRRERVLAFDPGARLVTTSERIYRVARQVLDCSGPGMVIGGLLGEVDSIRPVFATWAYFDVDTADSEAFWEAQRTANREIRQYDARRSALLRGEDEVDLPANHSTVLTQLGSGDWCWQIPLFGGKRLSVGVVSRHAAVPEARLDEVALSGTLPGYQLRRRPRDGEGAFDRLHSRSGFARQARRAAGESFILVGDAYSFADPIYSVGTAMAVNKAIEVASYLNEEGWGPEAAAGYSEQCEALRVRAEAAFGFWYDGSVMSDDAAAREVRDGFLVGAAFGVNAAASYGTQLEQCSLQVGEHRENSQVVDMAQGSIRPEVAALLDLGEEGSLGAWTLSDAFLCTDGLYLVWDIEEHPEMVMLMLPDPRGREQSFRRVEDIAMSYMARWGDAYPFHPDVQTLFDQVAERVEGQGSPWVGLAERRHGAAA